MCVYVGEVQDGVNAAVKDLGDHLYIPIVSYHLRPVKS